MSVLYATALNTLRLSSNKNHLIPRKVMSFNIGGKPTLEPISANGVIVGTVKEKGVPVSRRVFCYARNNGSLAATTTSDADGNYRFTGLALNPDYYVVSLDENGDKVQYNAVIQDLIKAKKVAL